MSRTFFPPKSFADYYSIKTQFHSPQLPHSWENVPYFFSAEIICGLPQHQNPVSQSAITPLLKNVPYFFSAGAICGLPQHQNPVSQSAITPLMRKCPVLFLRQDCLRTVQLLFQLQTDSIRPNCSNFRRTLYTATLSNCCPNFRQTLYGQTAPTSVLTADGLCPAKSLNCTE